VGREHERTPAGRAVGLAYAEEQQMAEMEREMKMQQSANEVSLFGPLHNIQRDIAQEHWAIVIVGRGRRAWRVPKKFFLRLIANFFMLSFWRRLDDTDTS